MKNQNLRLIYNSNPHIYFIRPNNIHMLVITILLLSHFSLNFLIIFVIKLFLVLFLVFILKSRRQVFLFKLNFKVYTVTFLILYIFHLIKIYIYLKMLYRKSKYHTLRKNETIFIIELDT